MEIRGSDFKALATDGDVQLGGNDWDQRLVDYVGRGVHPPARASIRAKTANTAGRLWRECEDAKRTLSARSQGRRSACDYKGQPSRVEVTREKFEEITLRPAGPHAVHHPADPASRRAGMERSSTACCWSAARPACRWSARCSGSSRGKEPDASVSADEAVAHGAALHAGLILLAQSRANRRAFSIKNVNSHSLGVVAIDPKTQRRRNAILIPRNTPLPVTAKRVFRTQKADQRSILVQIVEGESSVPDDCSQIGKCVVRDLPAGPAGPDRRWRSNLPMRKTAD